MALFHCRDCDLEFNTKLPDGSCPECYTDSGIEERGKPGSPLTGIKSETLTPPPLPANGPTLPDFFASEVMHAGPLADLVRTKIFPAAAVSRSSLALPHAGTVLDGSANGTPSPNVPKPDTAVPVVPKYVMPRLRKKPAPTSVPGHPSGTNSEPDASLNEYSALSDEAKLYAARAAAKLMPDSPVARLFLTVDDLRAATLTRVEDGAQQGDLAADSAYIQQTLKILEEIKQDAEKKLTETRQKSGIYGRVHSDSGGSIHGNGSSANLPGLGVQRLQRSGRVYSSVIVKQLPEDTRESDLYEYFWSICGGRSDVSNVILAWTGDRRRCRGFGYVKMSGDAAVRKVCAQKNHFIKGVRVSLEPFDEEDQYRRRKSYNVFVTGLSSFMAESALEYEITKSVGEIEDFYFHTNDVTPQVTNAYAKITLKDREKEKKVLEDGFIVLKGGRKCPCKPCLDTREYALKKRSDRKKSDAADESDGSDGDSVVSKGESAKKDQTTITDRDCRVCLEMEICVLLRPCRHLCVCETCVEVLQKVCPICRGPIQSYEKVFFS